MTRQKNLHYTQKKKRRIKKKSDATKKQIYIHCVCVCIQNCNDKWKFQCDNLKIEMKILFPCHRIIIITITITITIEWFDKVVPHLAKTNWCFLGREGPDNTRPVNKKINNCTSSKHNKRVNETTIGQLYRPLLASKKKKIVIILPKQTSVFFFFFFVSKKKDPRQTSVIINESHKPTFEISS